ncbi:MAG: hypothetical protein R2824_16560 [Saprospiraceae bacterium]
MKKLIIALLALLPIWANANAESCCDGLNASLTELIVANPDKDDTSSTKTQEQERMEASLIGKWQNTTYPFDLVALDGNPNERMEGAILSFEFRNDGTYTKTLGSANYKVVENGQWEISSDARQLIMYAEGSLVPDVATIKYQEYDEMVIEHALKCTHKPYCTGVKDFFFNKF